MAEKSIAKMGVKPVVTSDIVKQQKELEEQRRKIQEQKDEVMFYLNCQNLGYSIYLFKILQQLLVDWCLSCSIYFFTLLLLFTFSLMYHLLTVKKKARSSVKAKFILNTSHSWKLTSLRSK